MTLKRSTTKRPIRIATEGQIKRLILPCFVKLLSGWILKCVGHFVDFLIPSISRLSAKPIHCSVTEISSIEAKARDRLTGRLSATKMMNVLPTKQYLLQPTPIIISFGMCILSALLDLSNVRCTQSREPQLPPANDCLFSKNIHFPPPAFPPAPHLNVLKPSSRGNSKIFFSRVVIKFLPEAFLINVNSAFIVKICSV